MGFLGRKKVETHTHTHKPVCACKERGRRSSEMEGVVGGGNTGRCHGVRLTTHVYEHTLNISEEDRIRHTVVERLVGRLL